MDASNTLYIPSYSFKETDDNGYPMVQYLVRSKGETIEISEPVDSSKRIKDAVGIKSPIYQINNQMTANNFFEVCTRFSSYKLSYAQYPFFDRYSAATESLPLPPTPLTALAKAVHSKNSKLVKAIIKALPNKNICQKSKTDRELFVNQRMKGGLTATILHCHTLDKDQLEMEQKILKILIRGRANLNLSLWEDLSSTLRKGDTCLLHAIKRNMPSVIKYLIINGGELSQDCAIMNVVRLIDMIGIAQIKWINCTILVGNFRSTFPPVEEGINFYKCFQEVTEELKVKATNKYKYFKYYVCQQTIPADILRIIASIFITITLPSKFWWSGQNLPNENYLSSMLKKYKVNLPIIFHPSESQEKAARLFSLAGLQNESDEDGYPMAQYSLRIGCNTFEKWELRHTPHSADDFITACKSPIEMIEKDTTPEQFSQLCKQYPNYEFTHADRGWRGNDQNQCELRLTALAKGVLKGNVGLVQHLIDAIPNNMVCPRTKKNARELFVNMRMAGGLTAAFCVEKIKDLKVRIKILDILIRAGANLNLSIWYDYHCYKKGDTVLSRALNAEDT